MALGEALFSVRMHAECGGRHISGAERLVSADQVADTLRTLALRALSHPGGAPDAISLKAQALTRPLLTIPPLPVSEPAVETPAQARAVLAGELRRLGLAPEPVLSLLYAGEPMRGAILLDADSLRRLEPDPQRGVRASRMDWPAPRGAAKCHAKEALCLASKVAHCPWIIGELCISDDPDYTTGYFASAERGYIRIAHVKAPGQAVGGRIFLFRGGAAELPRCLEYLERQPVMVDVR